MDETWKARWVATLRSGNYKQGVGKLRDGKNDCCCLGVLCDIVDPKGWSKRPRNGCYRHYKLGGMPSFNIYKITGLTGNDAGTLSGMNDTEKSFSELADFIEANL